MSMFEPGVVVEAIGRVAFKNTVWGRDSRLFEDCNGELGARDCEATREAIELHAYGRHSLPHIHAFGEWGGFRVAPKGMIASDELDFEGVPYAVRNPWYVGEHRERKGFGGRSSPPSVNPGDVKAWCADD